MKFSSLILALVFAVVLEQCAAQASQPLRIVAAENFYGDIAQQIGGPNVRVESILSNPNQDPHEFEASPATARELADADIVIYSGADYDPWMTSLLSASKSASRTVIVVADLVGHKSGDNPHIWYDPPTMPALAAKLVTTLKTRDPGHGAEYDARLKTFLASLDPINSAIASMRQKYSGSSVTATEPVFGYMSAALGLDMRNQPFQVEVMNDTEPGASEIAAFEQDLKTRKAKVLFYNSQVTDDLTAHLKSLAKESNVAIVGVTETAPIGVSYQNWMLQQLNETNKALSGPDS